MKFMGSTVLATVSLLVAVPAVAQDAAAPAVEATVVEATPAVPVMVEKPVEVTTGTMLPSNTDVWLSVDSEITSKKMQQGDKIAFKVSRDVMMGQFVVIPRGTPAEGHVSYRTGKGVFGKSAKFEFDIDRIMLNGRDIPVAGHHRIEGRGNTGATVGAVVAVGVIGGLFVTGRSATMAQGSEWKASTKEPLAITVGN